MQSKLQLIPHEIHFTDEMIMSGTRSVSIKPPSYANSNTSATSYVYIDGKHHPVMQNSNYTMPHKYAISYNPLDAYLAWYGIAENQKFSHQISMTVSEITGSRVWDRQEFDNWFIHECKQPVFAQQYFGNDTWSLTFVSIEDLTAFRSWWFEPRGVSLRARRDYSMDHDAWKELTTEVYEWICKSASARTSKSIGFDLFTVEFESENDAVMFKLTWSDRLSFKEAV